MAAERPLPAAPRLVAALAMRSRCFLWAAVASLLALATLGAAVFWPILIREDFEAYLQCDGPQHGRLKALREARLAERAARTARAGPRRLREGDGEAAPRRLGERGTAKTFIKVIYATADGRNIFTPEGLYRIQEVERRLQSLPSYGSFCLSTSGGCDAPLSVISFFFASRDPKTGDIVPDGRGTELMPIQAMLASLGSKNAYFVDRYFGVSTKQAQALLQGNITRSVFRFGAPLHGFSSVEDRPHQQAELFKTFVRNELYPFLRDASDGSIDVRYYGDPLTSYEVEVSVWHDATYAIGSLVFIFCYLIWHLRSVGLALAALFCISLSFPLTYTCYCLVYGHGKMVAINFLSLFVVLGVGADDVFVLTDTWVHSRVQGSGDMALTRRLWSMYRKAGLAIFGTSATTAASFFANLSSSIGPLRQFGFFMGTCIAANWAITTTVYPLVLVGYDRRWAGGGSGRAPRWWRGLGGKSPGVGGSGQDGLEMEEHLVSGGQMLEECGAEPAGATSGGGSASRWRVPLLGVAFAGVLLPCAALVWALRDLRPASDVPQFFPKSSNLGALQELQKRFGNESEVGSFTGLRFCGGQVRSVQDCEGLHRTTPHTKPEGQEVQVDLEIQGHSVGEVEALRSAIAWTLAQELGAGLEDVGLEVGGPEVFRSRRMSARPNRLEPVDVAVHFRHLSEAQRAALQSFLADPSKLRTLREDYGVLRARVHGSRPSPASPPWTPLQAAPSPPTAAAPPSPPSPPWPSSPPSPSPSPSPSPVQPAPAATLAPARAPSHPQRPLAPPGPSAAPRPASPGPSVPWRPPPKLPRAATPPLAGLEAPSRPRGLSLDREVWVTVMLGFRPGGPLPGGHVLEESFDLRPPAAQAAMVELCDRIPHRKDLRVVHVGCWPQDFREFLRARGRPFPSRALSQDLRLFLASTRAAEGSLGLRPGGLPLWATIGFRTEFDTHSSGRRAQPFLASWDRALEAESARIAEGAGRSLGAAVAFADVFVRAEAEERVIGSALSSWLVSVVCALGAVAAFTRSIRLSAIATFAIFATSACSLFVIVEIFRWEFGLMEAVSLIIFCGFSVDYPLHVVQAYVNERGQGAEVRQALREVAGAVVAGCVTTVGAALFLLLCEIKIFTRFGQVLAVNMLFSLAFALAWIPAALELQSAKVDERAALAEASEALSSPSSAVAEAPRLVLFPPQPTGGLGPR